MVGHEDAEYQGPNLFRKTGLVFTCFFAANFLLSISIILFRDRGNPAIPLMYINSIILFHATAGFLLSSLFPRLHGLQPIILLVLTPLAMTNPSISFLSLGFFICAEILLHRLGYFEMQRKFKIFINVSYYYLCQILIGITTNLHYALIVVSLMFSSIFLIFLILAFGNSWVIYLKDPKPRLSLSTLNLTKMEAVYLRSLLNGTTIKSIAIESGVKESTVRNTLSRVYKKFDVIDKAGLIAKCEHFKLTD
jgi:DNA-binding CsgD family transcriptional regulator